MINGPQIASFNTKSCIFSLAQKPGTRCAPFSLLFYWVWWKLFRLFKILFICGWAGSSLLRAGFLSLWWAGVPLYLLTSRYAGSHCSSFSCGAQALGCMGFSSRSAWAYYPWHVGSSQTRDWTCVPCISRQILNQWTTREVLFRLFKSYHKQRLLLEFPFIFLDSTTVKGIV